MRKRGFRGTAEIGGFGGRLSPGRRRALVVVRLDPFDVARLTAAYPDALRDWLERNGFELPDRPADGLKPSVRAKGEYVAVRPAPTEDASDDTGDTGGTGSTGGSATGGRAFLGGNSGTAAAALRLRAPGAPRGELEKPAGRRMFLTAFRQEFPRPELISGDRELRRAVRDSAYQRVVYHDTLLTAGGLPVWLLTVGGGLLVTAGVLVAVLRGRRRRTVRWGPGCPAPAQDNWPS